VSVISAHEFTVPIPGVAHISIRAPQWPRWQTYVQFNRRAGQCARQGAYDIVHTQGSEGAWGDVVTAHSCHLGGMRASLRRDPSAANRLRKCLSPSHRAILALEKRTFSGAACLLAVSRRVGRQVRSAYPALRRTPIRIVVPGVDAQRYAPEAVAARRSQARRMLGVAADVTLFALAANAPRLKGADRLIQAFAQVRNRKTCLLIASAAGDDPALGALARRLGVGPRVRFLAAGGDAFDAYAAADVYAALPEYEGFGLAVFEAMACGLPVMVTRNAGVAELLADGREGLLLSALARPETVAAALERLSAVASLRRRLGEAGLRTARQYSWERMTAEIEAVYERVAKGKRRVNSPRPPL